MLSTGVYVHRGVWSQVDCVVSLRVSEYPRGQSYVTAWGMACTLVQGVAMTLGLATLINVIEPGVN